MVRCKCHAIDGNGGAKIKVNVCREVRGHPSRPVLWDAIAVAHAVPVREAPPVGGRSFALLEASATAPSTAAPIIITTVSVQVLIVVGDEKRRRRR